MFQKSNSVQGGGGATFMVGLLYHPLGHKYKALIQKMVPLASKLLVSEPKQISDAQLENLKSQIF